MSALDTNTVMRYFIYTGTVKGRAGTVKRTFTSTLGLTICGKHLSGQAGMIFLARVRKLNNHYIRGKLIHQAIAKWPVAGILDETRFGLVPKELSEANVPFPELNED
jgi:hypothetical protein